MYILTGGWYEVPSEYYKSKIDDYIEDYGVDNLLKDVPSDEADMFKGDLRVLGFIQ